MMVDWVECRRDSTEEGVTLVELLIVLVVASVIGGIIGSGILAAYSSARATNQRIDAIQEIESAQRRIVQDLRSATGIVLEDPDSTDLSSDLTIEFRRAGATETVQYRVEPPAELGSPARLIRADTNQTLITLLNNEDGTEPLFVYLDSRGNEITCSDFGGRACLGATSVRITIVRDIPDHPPVRTNTQVTIRNIRFVGA